MDEEQRKKDSKIFEADIKTMSGKLPHHLSKEFTFTTIEQQELAQLQTILVLAQRQQEMLINENVLKRIGIVSSPEVHIRYSIGLGRFVAFIPRNANKKTKEVKSK